MDGEAEPGGSRRLAMAGTEPQDAEKQALLEFLDAQRAIVLAIVADLADDALSAPPRGRHPGDPAGEIRDLRRVILHMIEETARHAGHLDIARELADNRTGLAQRY